MVLTMRELIRKILLTCFVQKHLCSVSFTDNTFLEKASSAGIIRVLILLPSLRVLTLKVVLVHIGAQGRLEVLRIGRVSPLGPNLHCTADVDAGGTLHGNHGTKGTIV